MSNVLFLLLGFVATWIPFVAPALAEVHHWQPWTVMLYLFLVGLRWQVKFAPVHWRNGLLIAFLFLSSMIFGSVFLLPAQFPYFILGFTIAIPVLIQILTAKNQLDSDFAKIALSAALITDLGLWILLTRKFSPEGAVFSTFFKGNRYLLALLFGFLTSYGVQKTLKAGKTFSMNLHLKKFSIIVSALLFFGFGSILKMPDWSMAIVSMQPFVWATMIKLIIVAILWKCFSLKKLNLNLKDLGLCLSCPGAMGAVIGQFFLERSVISVADLTVFIFICEALSLLVILGLSSKIQEVKT